MAILNPFKLDNRYHWTYQYQSISMSEKDAHFLHPIHAIWVKYRQTTVVTETLPTDERIAMLQQAIIESIIRLAVETN